MSDVFDTAASDVAITDGTWSNVAASCLSVFGGNLELVSSSLRGCAGAARGAVAVLTAGKSATLTRVTIDDVSTTNNNGAVALHTPGDAVLTDSLVSNAHAKSTMLPLKNAAVVRLC